MKKWTRIVIGIIIIIVLVVGAFYVGGILGYMSGISYSNSFEAAPEGIHTILILEKLHQGKIDDAIAQLELHLLGKLMLNASVSENYSPFNLMHDNRLAKKFSKMYENYRAKYPMEDSVQSIFKDFFKEDTVIED